MNENEKIMQEIYCPKVENLFFQNPVQPGNELNYGFNPNYQQCGYHYDKEMFYLIDFWNIKDNKYYISSYGRIFSNTREGREMCPVYDNGYLRIILYTNERKKKSFKIHRLVAMAFIPKSLEDILLKRDIVNHKNLIRSNNYYKNLEWVTESENTQHAFDNNAHGKIAIMKKPAKLSEWGDRRTGDKASMTRITDEQVHIICQNLIQGKSYAECCIAAGLENNARNRNVICNIAAGKRRNDIAMLYGIVEQYKKTKDIKKRVHLVIPVCKLLEQGYSIVAITKMLDIDEKYDRARMFVSSIKNRKSYTDISKDFNF